MSNVPFPFGGAYTVPHHHHQQQQQQQQQQHNGQAPMLNGTPASAQAPQQPAMPMAALPPQLLAALQGIAPEQLGAIFQAFQSGLIPMPPPSIAPAESAPHAIDPRLANNTAPSSHDPEASNADVDNDHEDGEIEDSEMDGASTPHTRGFLRTPPKGPRDEISRRGSHQFQQQAQQASRPGLTPRTSSSTLPKVTLPNGKAPVVTSTHGNVPLRPSKEAACKAFIREMHQAAYTYDDLVREVKDTKMLRRMYEQLSLPIPSSSTAAVAHAASSPIETVRKQIPPKPAKLPAAPPKDRSEYLAKLQAAKAKKTEAARGSATVPAATQPVQPVAPQTSQSRLPLPAAPPKAAGIASVVATQAAVKTPVPMSKEKTEELKRRLEAIKAKRAAEQNAKLSSDTVQTSSPANGNSAGSLAPSLNVPRPDAGSGPDLVEAAAKLTGNEAERAATDGVLSAQAVNSSFLRPSSGTASPSLNRGISLPGLSLPGLFTPFNPHPAHPTSSPQPITNGTSSLALPPVTFMNASGAEAGVTAPLPTSTTPASLSGPNAQRLLLGQRNNVRATERCVIEVSSDEEEIEDDEDDMDTDDSSEEECAPSTAPAKEVVKPLSGPQSGSSAPETPNAYKRKLEEIEQFKQQIAEKEKRRKLANFPLAHPVELSRHTDPTSHQGALPNTTHDVTSVTNLALDNSTPQAAPADVASTVPSPAAVAATRLARAQEKEALQRRLRELEALRSKHGSGSPALLQEPHPIREGAQADQSARIATTTPVAVEYRNDTMDDPDDEDDEDLYGDDTNNDKQGVNHQEAQDTPVQPLVDCQATTESSDRQQGTVAAALAPSEQPDSAEVALHHAMEVDRSSGVQLTESTLPESTQKSPNHEEDEYDDDDLDNVYELSTAVTQAVTPPKTPVEATGTHHDSDDAMDTSAESSDAESKSGSESIAAVEPAQQSQEEVSAASPGPSEIVDQQSNGTDLAPELQSAQEKLDPLTQADGSAIQSRYTPYESALRRFKDYRYHPEYTNTVPTGFKSLTYNHKIDPVKTVCPFELENGQCDDVNCGYQHFHQMNLHDNDLLRLMGTERTPARNPDEDQKWKEGLQNLVKELRTTNFGKDAGLIAQRIAEYRRSFVNDPTRVVLLDD